MMSRAEKNGCEMNSATGTCGAPFHRPTPSRERTATRLWSASLFPDQGPGRLSLSARCSLRGATCGAGPGLRLRSSVLGLLQLVRTAGDQQRGDVWVQ
jgi:hypothetical protein